MNTSSQANYADMIELSVKTCTVTEVPAKKKRFRKKVSSEDVKKAVIDTVNAKSEQDSNEQKSDKEEVLDFVQLLLLLSQTTHTNCHLLHNFRCVG